MRVTKLAALNVAAMWRRYLGLALLACVGTALCSATLSLGDHAAVAAQSQVAEGTAWRSIEVTPVLELSQGSSHGSSLTPTRITQLKGMAGVEDVQPSLTVSAGIKTEAVAGVLLNFSMPRSAQLPPLVSSSRTQVFPLSAGEIVLPSHAQGFDLSPLLGRTVPITYTQMTAQGQGAGRVDQATVVALYDSSWQVDGADVAYAGQAQVVKWAAALSGTPEADFLVLKGYDRATVVAANASSVAPVLRSIQVAGFQAVSLQQKLSELPAIFRLARWAGRLVFVALAAFLVLGALALSGALVRQRTREIGLLKAVGYRDRAVMSIFLVEMVFVGVMSTLLGLVAGVGMAALIARLLARSVDLKVYLPSGVPVPSLSLVLVSAGVVLGGLVVGAFVPAWRGARMEPSQALRDW